MYVVVSRFKTGVSLRVLFRGNLEKKLTSWTSMRPSTVAPSSHANAYTDSSRRFKWRCTWLGWNVLSRIGNWVDVLTHVISRLVVAVGSEPAVAYDVLYESPLNMQKTNDVQVKKHAVRIWCLRTRRPGSVEIGTAFMKTVLRRLEAILYALFEPGCQKLRLDTRILLTRAWCLSFWFFGHSEGSELVIRIRISSGWTGSWNRGCGRDVWLFGKLRYQPATREQTRSQVHDPRSCGVDWCSLSLSWIWSDTYSVCISCRWSSWNFSWQWLCSLVGISYSLQSESAPIDRIVIGFVVPFFLW